LQKLKAISTIIRLPNLIFIFLTQIIVYWKFIHLPNQAFLNAYTFSFTEMVLLSLSTTLIAAAGYIINDYFDVKIDEINKPNRVTVELQFKRRHIMFAHIVLNIIALFIALPMALKARHISLIGIQIVSILLLILYSAYFKRKPISGNLAVAFLTALTVFTPAFYETKTVFSPYFLSFKCIALFAFVLTWMREIVKDLEDIKGDEADGCRTMPIVFGIRISKLLLWTLAIFTIFFSGYVFYKIGLCNMLIDYILLMLAISNIIFCIQLYKANQHRHFKWLSRFLKIITFAGILSIAFI
jgi:4-hydroxybenzoate polyprenyltransferase